MTELDLDAIKRSLVVNRDSQNGWASRVVEDLVAEVERLRENAEARERVMRRENVILRTAERERDKLLDEVRQLRAQRVLDNEEAARLYDFARDKGAALERDATVAWLRSEPEKGVACDGHRHANGRSCVVFTDMTAPDLADAIERGDHRLIDPEKK